MTEKKPTKKEIINELNEVKADKENLENKLREEMEENKQLNEILEKKKSPGIYTWIMNIVTILTILLVIAGFLGTILGVNILNQSVEFDGKIHCDVDGVDYNKSSQRINDVEAFDCTLEGGGEVPLLLAKVFREESQ